MKKQNSVVFCEFCEFHGYHICDFSVMVFIFRAVFTLLWQFCCMSSHSSDGCMSPSEILYCFSAILYIG